MKNFLETITMEDVRKYNEEYEADYKRGLALSESRPYLLNAMEYFINTIRPNYTYTEDYSKGTWVALQIRTVKTKYGITFIYLDHERKLWRTRQSFDEFYGGGVVD